MEELHSSEIACTHMYTHTHPPPLQDRRSRGLRLSLQILLVARDWKIGLAALCKLINARNSRMYGLKTNRSGTGLLC